MESTRDQRTIAHIRALYLGLSETFIYTQITGLRNFRVVVLTERAFNLEHFPFPNLHALPGSRWNPWRLLQLLANRTGRFGSLFYEHTLRHEQAGLIHAHFGPEGVRSLPLKRRLKIPLVTTFYGYDMSQLPREPFWRRSYQNLFVEGDLFLVEGPTMRAGLVALGCPEEKVALQRIPIAMDRYAFRERQRSGDGIIRLLFCGRFVEKKGLEFALRALALSATKCPGLRLRVIGDGELRGHVESLIAELGIRDRVTLLGSLGHSEVIAEMQEAHALVQPSVVALNGDSEGGAPTILLESQASGIPVLATRHADIPFVVGEGAGILVPERSVDELAEAMVALAEHPERWAEMGRRGRRHVEQFHALSVNVAQLENHYTRLLGLARLGTGD